MVLVGDINTSKEVSKLAAKAQAGKAKGKGKGKIKAETFRILDSSGEWVVTKAVALQTVSVALWESGRVATVVMEKKEKPKAKEEKSEEAKES